MGVHHAMVMIDGIALCIGVGVMLVALLSWERSGIRWLREMAFVLAGAAMLLLRDLLHNYRITTGGPEGLPIRIVLALFGGTGSLVLVLTIPPFVRGIVPAPLTRTRRVLGRIGLVLLPLVGVLEELTGADAFSILDDVGLTLLFVVGAMMLLIGYRSIAVPETRRMIKRIIWVTAFMVVLVIAQVVILEFVPPARSYRQVRFMQAAYYLGIMAVVLIYAVKYLFRPLGMPEFMLSGEFAAQYGISNRERDIISMIVQGHANRVVAERLFISDRTVKNHISSIYRKTGASNKVQLLNMVRNHPGFRGEAAAPSRTAPAAPLRPRT